MTTEAPKPPRSVQTQEELEALLLRGLESGEPKPVSDEQWDALRRRALANTEIRKSG